MALITHGIFTSTFAPGLLYAGLRAALAGIFLVSGTGKVWDLPGTRQALSDFGVPDALTSQGSRVLPVVEILVGFGLLFDFSQRVAAAGAAGLSLAFALGIANLLRQGRTPPCHCFGAIQSGPVGRATFVRAALLLVVSLACLRHGASLMTPDFISRLLVGGGGLLTVSAASNFALWKKLKRRHFEASRLGVGQRVPAVRLFDGRWLNELFSKQSRSLVVVTTSGCGSCKEVKAHLERWKKTVGGELTILELHAQPKAEEGEQARDGIYDFPATELPRLVRSTPEAFVVDSKGFLLSPPVVGAEQIEALLRVTLSQA